MIIKVNVPFTCSCYQLPVWCADRWEKETANGLICIVSLYSELDPEKWRILWNPRSSRCNCRWPIFLGAYLHLYKASLSLFVIGVSCWLSLRVSQINKARRTTECVPDLHLDSWLEYSENGESQNHDGWTVSNEKRHFQQGHAPVETSRMTKCDRRKMIKRNVKWADAWMNKSVARQTQMASSVSWSAQFLYKLLNFKSASSNTSFPLFLCPYSQQD